MTYAIQPPPRKTPLPWYRDAQAENQRMTTATLVPGMPIEEYHARPEISKSGLDFFHRSPLHFARRQPLDTEATRLGAAAHDAILSPDGWRQRWPVWRGPSRATREGKAAWADFQLEHRAALVAGRVLEVRAGVDPSEQIAGMAAAVRSHPILGVIVADSANAIEHSIIWRDEETGVACRCRPDVWSVEDACILDLKTTEDASPRAFARSALAYRYHCQSAFYRAGVRAVTGRDHRFILVAVEKSPPHGVAVYEIDDTSTLIGEEEIREDLRRYAECLATDTWPGYPDAAQILELPIRR